MNSLRKQTHRSGLIATAVLHVLVGVSLLQFSDVQSAPQTTVLVSLIDSAGQAYTPTPPKPLSKAEKKSPMPQPTSAPSTQVADTATATPNSAPDTPASESAIVRPLFDAEYLNNPKPAYPLASRRMGEQGRVMVRVFVRADGTPADVALDRSSGSSRLDQAALDAVRKWRFVPARRGDTAIAAPVLVPVAFTLEG